MKNLKYFLFIVVSIFISCEDDSYSIEYTDNEVKQDLNVTLTLDRERVAATTNVGFTVAIESALSVDATVTVASINKCGGPLSHLAETTTGTALIKAGKTSGMGTINAADFNTELDELDWDGATDCFTFDVTGIALAEGDDPYVASASTPAILTAVNADYMSDADDDAVMISMDWKNPDANDFDMYVTNANGSVFYEIAESGSRFEGDFFDNDSDAYYPAADGVYLVWCYVYTQEAADVPSEIYFTHPITGFVDVIAFTMASGSSGFYPVATITKTTDAEENMSYEIAAY
ncbi:MAG: hypothetical protein O2810_02630 [Bacteroidetes bacterium]|nr:hypothetical protein [Bacteroidota bacterium]MDA0888291.1 hypothetical protein [Bacteroidota bacterium]MDA1084414.1 hypothetical protein [Bacteroidota bacterium]